MASAYERRTKPGVPNASPGTVDHQRIVEQVRAQLGGELDDAAVRDRAADRTGRARRGRRRTRPPGSAHTRPSIVDRPGDDRVAPLAEDADHLVDGALDRGIVLQRE